MRVSYILVNVLISDNCDLRIDELHILELFDYTNDYNFKSYKTNDNCAYLNKFEDIIIWKKTNRKSTSQ